MRAIDITGQTFGLLTVLEFYGTDGKNRYWRCHCKCGTDCVKTLRGLRSGRVKSCGCLKYREDANNPNFKHGFDGTDRLYRTWNNMRDRCYCKTATTYERYGGRGIKICDEWADFNVFREWALSSGYSDDLTIDRIDNNGDYCPENCRWATQSMQARNRRSTHFLTYDGETLPMIEWAERYGMDVKILSNRIRRGWSVEEAITRPLKR